MRRLQLLRAARAGDADVHTCKVGCRPHTLIMAEKGVCLVATLRGINWLVFMLSVASIVTMTQASNKIRVPLGTYSLCSLSKLLYSCSLNMLTMCA